MIKNANYHHGNLRADLIATALRLLDEGGVEAVGIRQVARKVGVAHSAPANHFKNKKALYTALAISIFGDLKASIQAEVDENVGSQRDSMHHFAKPIFDFGIKYPNRYRLLWRNDCIDSENEQLVELMEDIYQLLTGALQEYARQKNIDVESQAIAMWSLIHGYVSLRLTGNLAAGHDGVSGVARETAIIDVLVDGLLES